MEQKQATQNGQKTHPGREKLWSVGLWALPLILTAVQLAWTNASAHQVRMEELAESVRNVYWLEHGLVYDGISSNVGWYATLMAAYQLFGFDIHGAKLVRLGLHLVSLLCAAALLRRWLGARGAWLPLVALGLSPCLLFFNTMQTSYGIDLQYAPICLLLLLWVRFEARPADLARSALCWAAAMWAAMSYPAFLLYMPMLGAAYLWRMLGKSPALDSRGKALHLAAAAVGLLLPLGLALLWMEDPARLLNDPMTDRGIFRGGGKLTADPALVLGALRATFGDLLLRGESYYFTVPRPDFAGPLGWGALAVALGSAGLALRSTGRQRGVILLAAALVLVALVLPAFTSKGYPGLRRSTGALAGLYLLYIAGWRHLRARPPARRWLRLALGGLFLLLPAHHLAHLSANQAALAQKSFYREEMWFELREEPRPSLQYLLQATADGRLALKCLDGQERPLPCRYGEVFAALDGYRFYNGLPRPPVRAYDWKTGKDIELSIDLWRNGHFPR